MPRKNIRKGGNTKAASTAADPLAHAKSLSFLLSAMAHSNLIQLVLLMEVQPRVLITVSPGNSGR
jgi:hypothetical protein